MNTHTHTQWPLSCSGLQHIPILCWFCVGRRNAAKIAGPGRKRRSSDSDPSESGSAGGSEVRNSRPVSGKWLKMASSSSSASGPASRRRAQRGAEESSSKKKQKDRANQESREAKRAATAASLDTKKGEPSEPWCSSSSRACLITALLF